jgi:uncharacterized protein (DUF2237 family)
MILRATTNVLGEPLEACSYDPMTGWLRNGCCETSANDHGQHTICTEVTASFLEFSRQMGNDLSTPRPELDFPGLKPGDRWCACATRWLQAYEAGVAPPVILAACEATTLDIVSLDVLRAHALDA